MIVKTGTTKEFFAKVRNIMHSLDENKPIQSSSTITFDDPSEMLHFLNVLKCGRFATTKDFLIARYPIPSNYQLW